MKLSKRLNSIYEMVPYGIAADIGADHGKLIISLAEDNKILKGYAIENKIGPFNKLNEAISNSIAKDKITSMFSDGIKDIPPEVNILIIAGMGGDNIINIINKNIEKLKNIEYIITDAHSCVEEVRKYICNNGFSISEEKIVYEESIYYQIIKFAKSEKAIYSEEDYEFGPILRREKNQLFKDMYENRLMKIRKILDVNSIPKNRIEELLNEEKRIKSQLWRLNLY